MLPAKKSIGGDHERCPDRAVSGIRPLLRRWGGAAIDVVFPPRCLLCHTWNCAGEPALCTLCAATVSSERSVSVCPGCAADIAPFTVQDGRCPECRDRPNHVSGVVRVGRWRPEGGELSSIGRLLHDYKYRGRRALEPALADWLADAVRHAAWFDSVEAIVPVPTHWTRRLRRPFYPADELAELLGDRLDRPVVPALRRVRGGKRQIGLSFSERQTNIRHAFVLRRGFALESANVLLVDDVRTTGATLDECARVLRHSGAGDVHAAVIAKAGWRHLAGQKIQGV